MALWSRGPFRFIPVRSVVSFLLMPREENFISEVATVTGSAWLTAATA
jgi:hypothetical protein